MSQKTAMESFTSEYSMTAGDNALSRKHLNHSILSQNSAEVPNESQFREKMNKVNPIQPSK